MPGGGIGEYSQLRWYEPYADLDNQLSTSRLRKKAFRTLLSLSVISPIGVGVGIMVAHDPLHGSGRAALPHPALASGNNANGAQRMTLCCQTHPLQRTGRTLPALSPGARFAGAGSPWPVPFPPPPPPPVARPCSETSLVLWDCPTSWVRSSSAYVLGLPDASRRSIGGGRAQDLPVPVRGVSVRARGLRPRGTRTHLAISMRPVVPCAYLHSVGVPKRSFTFAAQYPARTYPCQRFGETLAGNSA